jgi:hypothetical protein
VCKEQAAGEDGVIAASRWRRSLGIDLKSIMNPTRKPHRSQPHRKPYRPHWIRLRSGRELFDEVHAKVFDKGKSMEFTTGFSTRRLK